MSEENTQENTENNEIVLTEEQKKDYLETLKKKADLLGITYSNRIGIEALKLKINNKLEGIADEPEEQEKDEEEASAPKTKTNEELRQELYNENMRLVRCRIDVNDPTKKDLQGEFWTFSNEILGDVKYFVPYGEVTDNGWHIPFCIYKMLKNKHYNYREKLKKNQRVTDPKGRKSRMFNIELMDPLTDEEREKLAREQAARGAFTG